MSTTDEPSNLIAVVQYFRHGHRTPIFQYPNDPHGEDAYWPLEEAVLTNKGKQQLYELGKFTRERYKHFLPELCPIKNFHVFTTDKPRTIQSAQVFSAGLYPVTDDEIWNENIPWNPIPTFTAEEYLFRSDPSDISPAYARGLKAAMDEFLEEFKNDPHFDIIVSNSGFDELDYMGIAYLFDTLTVQDSLGLQLPEWTKAVYPNFKYHHDYLQCVTKTDAMKRLFVGPQLHYIFQHFDRMIKDPNSGPKLLSFSGHDVNIAGVLDTFDALERHMPPYASSLYIELKEKNGEHFVNVYYKQKDVVPIRVRGADFDCKFEDFKELLKDYAITKKQYYEENS